MSASFVAVTFGTNEDASGIGMGATSMGRKLRRLVARGVVVGTRRLFEETGGGLNPSVDGFSGIVGGGVIFNSSADGLLDILAGRRSEVLGELSKAPVVDIRTSI